jgi:high-affinity nickel-transport protein
MALHHQYAATNDIGGVLGTLVSTFFLFAIGFVNLVVLRSVYQTFRRVRSGKPYVEEDVDLLLGSRGILAKIFRPLFRMVDASWHMYPIGVLFGLGFDTATEIGVLGISAAEAAKGLSLCSILIFPALFAAGMSLVDTTDSILMVQAYGWALAKPLRKLYYNLTITFVSVVVAFAVGAIESLGLVADHLHPRGSFWVWIEQLNKNFGVLGYAMIAFFAASWLISVCIYKWKRFDAAELTS